MTWRLLYALIGLSITGVTTVSQEPPQAERLSRGQPPLAGDTDLGGPDLGDSALGDPGGGNPAPTFSSVRHAGYFQSSGLVRFQLVNGRIRLERSRHRKGSQSRRREGIYESILVTARRGIPSVHYVCKTRHQELQLDVQDVRQLRLESRLSADGAGGSCQLFQPAVGQIVWTLDESGQTQSYKENTLLHLRRRDPRRFDLHFGPLVTRMLGGVSLGQITQDTDVLMLRQSARPARVTSDQIESWVYQLSSPRRRSRIEAHRELVAGGRLVVPKLDVILRMHQSREQPLDPEQASRIKQVLSQLDTQTNDRPATLAKLLINDPSYWKILLPTLNDSQRRLAHQRLESFGAPSAWNDSRSLGPAPSAASRIASADLVDHSSASSSR